jgi:hypothetical protein
VVEHKVKFGIQPNFDLDIDVCGLEKVGISADADLSLVENVYAAVTAFILDSKSIDYTKSRYNNLPSLDVRDKRASEFLSRANDLQRDFYQTAGMKSNAPCGTFAADLALVRSSESLKLVLYAARRGYLTEPFSMMRSLFEQLSYAVHVFGSSDQELVFRTKPQATIGGLRRHFSWAGRAYGVMSTISHYHPELHGAFVTTSQDGEQALVRVRSWEFKAVSLAWLFFVIDLRVKILILFYRDFVEISDAKKLVHDNLSIFDELFEDLDIPLVQDARSFIADSTWSV